MTDISTIAKTELKVRELRVTAISPELKKLTNELAHINRMIAVGRYVEQCFGCGDNESGNNQNTPSRKERK